MDRYRDLGLLILRIGFGLSFFWYHGYPKLAGGPAGWERTGDAVANIGITFGHVQESGVVWGFGSDGSRANQIRPFTTLWWAVTGKMVGGMRLLRQTIGREQALVAHTRSNAYLLFRERDLGSIEAGKFADLAVLDRDYLSVPADQIKDITSLMTMVGGRIVHDTGVAGR